MVGFQRVGTAMAAEDGAVLRVEWTPGSDLLTGVCHCGAEYRAEGPLEVWEWLLAHPEHAAG